MALSVAIALPLIGLVLWSGLRLIRLDRIRVENSTAQVTQVVAAHIERVLQSTRSVVDRVAQREGRKAGSHECDPLLMQLPGVDDAVQNAATLDTLGHFTCSAIPLPPSVPPEADREWFVRARRADSISVGGMQRSRVSGEWIAVVSGPITGPDERRRGYVGIALNLQLLTRIIQAVNLPAGSTITIFDDRGRVVARAPDEKAWIGQRPLDSRLADSVLHGSSRHFRAPGLDGQARHYARAPIPFSGWQAVVGLPVGVVFGPGRDALLGSAMVSLAILVLALALARYVALRTLEPVRAIADATERVATGRLDVTVPEVGPTEFAAVARRFNGMARSLRVTEAGLRESEARYRRFIDTSAEGILTVDATGRVELVNRRFMEMLGQPLHTLVDAGLPALIAPEARPDFVAALARSTTGGRQVVEYRLPRPDGTSIWARFAISAVFDTRGEFTCHFVVASDLSERRREEEELRRSRARLQELAAGLEDAREAERTRVAREIHDELGQSLVGLTMDVAWIASRLPDDALELRERSAEMRALLDATADSVRRIAAELRPGVLDDLGLEAAVSWQAEEITRRAGLPVSLAVGPLPAVDPALATALFRILQEALTNVVRHAKAGRVWVRLAAGNGMILLEVEDDGVGLSAAASDGRRRFGLLGMEERVRTWAGTLELESTPGAGTVVRVRVPVPDPNEGRSE